MVLRTMALFAVLSTTAAIADTSELWLEWQGLGSDAREVSLMPGQSAVVEIYFRIRSAETFDSIRWRNEAALHLEQTETAALLPGWVDYSTDGALGGPGTDSWFQAAIDIDAGGPGTFLVGTQTIRLNDVSDGNPMEVAIDVNTLQVLYGDGWGSWLLVASDDSGELDEPYTYHLGVGSPGFVDGLNYVDARDPLIVNPIPEPSSLLLLGLGMATATFIRRRRPKR